MDLQHWQPAQAGIISAWLSQNDLLHHSREAEQANSSLGLTDSALIDSALTTSV